ncbi:MAG: hypothetical protein HKN33_14975 [Pyrinomonadaceae bacterium]|nr:hypothetical protein [Pyrinomonadaceae bacterium]
MNYSEVVSDLDRQRIDRALNEITKYADAFQRKLARFISRTELVVFVGPVSVVHGSGSVQLIEPEGARRALKSGILTLSDASRFVRLNIARETIDTGGQRGIEGTLVHEGKHAMDFAKLLASASEGNPDRFFNPNAFQKEYSAHLTSAFYLMRRGGEYTREGLSLGLLKETDGHISVDPIGIRRRLKRNYRLSPENPGALLDTVANPRIVPAIR